MMPVTDILTTRSWCGDTVIIKGLLVCELKIGIKDASHSHGNVS